MIVSGEPCNSMSSTPLGGRVSKSQCKASCNGTADHHEYLGYIGAVVAIVFFGSNFVPVKKYETGDGKSFHKIHALD